MVTFCHTAFASHHPVIQQSLYRLLPQPARVTPLLLLLDGPSQPLIALGPLDASLVEHLAVQRCCFGMVGAAAFVVVAASVPIPLVQVIDEHFPPELPVMAPSLLSAF